MFNLDELVQNEEIQLNGEILHIKPISKGFADRFLSLTMKIGKGMDYLDNLNKNIKETKKVPEDFNKKINSLENVMKDVYKMVAEYLSRNEEGKVFTLKDLDDIERDKVQLLIKHIQELISDTEKK